jgi:hypothetical protein
MANVVEIQFTKISTVSRVGLQFWQLFHKTHLVTLGTRKQVYLVNCIFYHNKWKQKPRANPTTSDFTTTT